MLCTIMREYSDGTSEHEERFEGGRQSVYEERLLGIGGFLFLLTLLVLLYRESSETLKHLRFVSCPDFPNTNFEHLS